MSLLWAVPVLGAPYIVDLNADKFNSFISKQVLLLPYIFLYPISVEFNLAILVILIQILEILSLFFFLNTENCLPDSTFI